MESMSIAEEARIQAKPSDNALECLDGAFGQVVIGPPGSGKTTYCAAMLQFLSSLGRKVHVVNLDPANNILPYKCSLNLTDLIRLDEVMMSLGLGPNGGLVFCLSYLAANRDWLAQGLSEIRKKDAKAYFIFDCPGQVELYTHHTSLRELIEWLTGSPAKNQLTQLGKVSEFHGTGLGLRLASVHLVDSHYCCDAGKFISCLITCLRGMLQLGLPHVNLLSKIDLIEQNGSLPFNLDFFTEVLDLQYLIDSMQDDPFFSRYKKLNEAMISLIQDHNLIRFLVVNVQESSFLQRVIQDVDKANGYIFGETSDERNMQSLMCYAAGAEYPSQSASVAQEKYIAK